MNEERYGNARDAVTMHVVPKFQLLLKLSGTRA